MTGVEPVEIGQRARIIRRRRGLSLDVAAGLAGISKSYLGMLENGQRHFERRGLLDDLAAALGCSVVDLTGQPYLPVDRASADALATLPGIRRALNDCTLDEVPPEVRVRPLPQLVADADTANAQADEVRYGVAGRAMGDILTELHVYAATGKADERRQALAALAQVSQAAYTIAKHLGHVDLAVQAARRGYDAAHRLAEPALLGYATWRRATSLVHVDARHRSSTLLAQGIDDLTAAAQLTAEDTSAAQMLGFLHLSSAASAAASHHPDDAHAHLDEAARVAERIGEGNAMREHFGPTNVKIWRVYIGVELQEGASAAEEVLRTPINAGALGAGRAAALHFDLARVLAQEGGSRDVEAVRHLDTADRIASQRLRNDPVARELVLDLHARARRRVWELDSLRNRFGVALHA